MPSPTTFAPAYASPTASVTPRGGTDHLDRDLSAGYLQLDARGRPSLARGAQRMVSRIVRALLTDQGSWWADVSFGSAVSVGFAVPHDLALALSDIALHEARSYRTGPLAPDERIAGITVHAVQQADDPRSLSVAMTITTAAQTSFPVTLTI